ncbi:MAG: hypothetical protein R3B84_03070 [Zavarzinella sp.]
MTAKSQRREGMADRHSTLFHGDVAEVVPRTDGLLDLIFSDT